ncbi:hypothetical protein [Zoogloea sp.]|uniref:hypothetical protein n=1 Tax=Zoogloea sp. TaxID=49181 RepID=UPI0025F040CE|nr:hypothetical protein [Zoogloea sp.]MCK6394989.1 hypothetical protein [Zoogloea sp.]MCK6408617.1 hypothetical protein [Thauera sp.]
MSSPSYTVLKLFKSPRGHLAEISRTRDRCETRGNEWVWIAERHVTTLQLRPGRGALDFEEGQLHLKDDAGELRWLNGEIETLSRVAVELPQPSLSVLDSHLS